MSFDDRIARVNGAVMGRFGTTTALVTQPHQEDQTWQVIFDEHPLVLSGTVTFDAAITVSEERAASIADKKSALITIRETAYRIRKTEPDGLGMVGMMLVKD